MNRKHLITLLAGVGMTVIPSTAFAGEGDATALRIDGILTISDCHAEEGSAECTSLSVLGEDVAGSSQTGAGTNTGSLGGGEDPSGSGGGHVWLFRSDSNVDGSGNSESSSSALSVDLGGQVQVEVLRAQANSNGDAESDGVYVNLAGEEIHVLHAESTGGQGNAAVAVIGGNYVAESGSDGGVQCPLEAAPVVQADIVCASGSRAGVVDNIEALDGNVTGDVVTANSRDAAPEVVPDPVTPTNEGGPVAGNPEPPALARTGMDALALLMTGLIAAGAGETLRRREGSFVSFA